MAKHTQTIAITSALLLSVPAWAQQVGTAAGVSPAASSRSGQGALRQVRLGDHVLHNQHFQTDANGVVQILLADGTSFTIGPRSTLTIDEFVYDPRRGTARVAASAGRGVLRFIGGAASKPGGSATVKTPVGVAGIRGAIVDFALPGDGPGPLRIDLHYGDGVSLSCNNGAGGALSAGGQSMSVSTDGDGCGVIRHAPIQQPLNPGQVPAGAPGAGQPLAGDAGGLGAAPNGLAGFSGAPMPEDTTDRSQPLQTDGSPGLALAEQQLQQQLLALIRQLPPVDVPSPMPQPPAPAPEPAPAPAPEPAPAPAPEPAPAPAPEPAPAPAPEPAPAPAPEPAPAPAPEPAPAPAPAQTLEGSYRGFAGALDASGQTRMPGTAELTFSTANSTVSARISPMQWEGLSWELDASEGRYAADNDFDGSNITLDPNAPNTLQSATDPTLLCDCNYLTWGRWNAGIEGNGTSYGPFDGYWVAGQLSEVTELPLSGQATYNGHAVGMVSDGVDITHGVQGDFQAVVDFGTGQGSLQISNFDGRSFGSSNLDINNSGMLAWGFQGELSDGADINGQYQAGFASDGSDPAAAMIGTFSADDANAGWSASGVFGGTRDGSGGAQQP